MFMEFTCKKHRHDCVKNIFTSTVDFINIQYVFIFFFWNKGIKEGKTGKSLGKERTGSTTLKEATGEPLGAGMGLLRALLLWIEIGLIGFCGLGLVALLWPLWDPKRQTLLSDKATGAVVYKD